MNFDAFEKKAKELGVLGIVVTKDGKEIGKKLWDEQCRRNVYSASKSFTSTAVGIAVKEGLLSLDEKLVDCFAEDLPETVSDNLAKATVKDLLTMCLGQEKAELMGAQRPVYEEEDWVKMSLAFPFVYEPGTKFVYNNVGPYLAGVLVERRAGCDLNTRLRNKRNRMTEDGCTKTKINALNKMDVIEDDKKLREIFSKIVTEYEIRYCVFCE